MSNKHLCYLGCPVLTREIGRELNRVKSLLDLRFVPAGLHEQPEVLRRFLQEEIDRIEDRMDLPSSILTGNHTYQAILLGFGLCNRATAGLYSRRLPLIIPRAHDCITLLLGSREVYQQLFEATPNNYWYSCGWIERYLPPGPERAALLQENYLEKYGEEDAAFLMEAEREWQSQYTTATFINWNLPGTAKYRLYTQKCAAFLKWDYREITGDPRLLRDFLAGRWDEERFLIVPPGKTIQPSYDNWIITAE